ncbi:MAG: polysaccharide lyase [Leeuwenhoekiella sp.]
MKLINSNGYARYLGLCACTLILSLLFLNLSCNEDTIDELSEESSIEFGEEPPLTDGLSLNKASSGEGDKTHYLNAGANPEGDDGKCRPWGGVTGSFAKRHIDGISRSSYNIRFEFKFHKYFDFDRGGKIGYGFNIGDGVAGCRGSESRDNKGGSFRIMWRGINDPSTGLCTVDEVKTTKANIIPYIYHRRMPNNCGDDFGKTFRIERDKWYTVVMKYRANTGNNADGLARVEIGEHGQKRTVLLNETKMVWSYSNPKRKVSGITYSLFRGGGDAQWASHQRSSVQFRQVQLDF